MLHFAALRAILIIQRWYRRYLARLEARRLQAWSIYESLEYANENDQTRVGRVFIYITCMRVRAWVLVRQCACASVVCVARTCMCVRLSVRVSSVIQPVVTPLR